jgi:hypothetical protein
MRNEHPQPSMRKEMVPLSYAAFIWILFGLAASDFDS